MSSRNTTSPPAVVNGKDPLADIAGVVDLKLEESGEWFGHPSDASDRVGPNEIDGFRHLLIDENGNGLRRIRVRSSHCQAFRDAAADVARRAMRMPRSKRSKFQEDMRIHLLAKHCVADWEFTNRQGQEIPCEVELVERLLREPQYRHHAGFIQIGIATHQGDVEREMEEDAGN